MKRILLAVALYGAVAGLYARTAGAATPPASGRELPGTELIPYSSPEEAAAAPYETKYKRDIHDWKRTDRRDGAIYSSQFAVPFAWANRQVIFHLPEAPAGYEVRINGQTAGESRNGNLPADYNITKFVREGMNTIEIDVAKASATAPLESWKQGRELPASLERCYVSSPPTLRIRDVLVTRTYLSGSDLQAEIAIVVRSHALNPRTSRIHYDLRSPADEQVANGYRDITLDMRREDTIRFTASIPRAMAWSAEQPTCYTLNLRTQHEGRTAEAHALKIGFRTFVNRSEELRINGDRETLRAKQGVDPSIGIYDLSMLREEGYNTIVLAPGTIPQRLLRDCDRVGMYVIPTVPIDTSKSGSSIRKGGNPSNDPAWREDFLTRAAECYHTTKAHPSVIGFLLAAEHSANGINLYDSYLLLKSLEKERPVLYFGAGGEWNSDKLALSSPTANNAGNDNFYENFFGK